MSILERCTHAVLILVCLLSAGLLLEHRFGRRPHAQIPPARELQGRALEVPKLNWTANRTVAIFLNSHCHFCTASMPFYKTIATAVADSNGSVGLAILSAEEPSTVRQYLKEHGVASTQIYQITGQTSLRYTPTLLVVNRKGIVQKVIEGELDGPRQQEFMAALIPSGMAHN